MSFGRACGVIALAAILGSSTGCLSSESAEFLHEKADITSDDLDMGPSSCARRVEQFDLEVAGYDKDRFALLDAVVHGFEHHPALALAKVHYEGEKASSKFIAGAEPTPPSPLVVKISCDAVYHTSPFNSLIAFPGMIPFLPVWIGYGWRAELTFRWTISKDGAQTGQGERLLTVRFREKNAARSALFHLWPSTGFFGVQFLIGIVLSPTFLWYDAEATNPLLAQALEPRLGAVIAELVRRDVAGCSPEEEGSH